MECDIDYSDFKNTLDANQIYQFCIFLIVSFVTLILGLMESCFTWKNKIQQNDVKNLINTTPGTLALTEIETPLSCSFSSIPETTNSFSIHHSNHSNLFREIPNDEDDSDDESDISFGSMTTSCTNVTNMTSLTNTSLNTRSSYHPIVK